MKTCKNVKIGKNPVVGDFVIIGQAPRNKKDGELGTTIGENATIRSHTVIYAGNKIGNNFETGHMVTIRESNEIGNNVSIGTKSTIEHHVIIKDNVRIHSNAFVPEYTILGKNCWIGPCAVITNAKYPLSKRAKEELKSVIVEESAIIGANATILPGIKIGKNAIVGAGSVVTKNVSDGSVVAGNPAVKINKRKNLVYGNEEKAYR